MNLVRRIGAELLGLFVDDGRFAALIFGWITSCALVLPHLRMPGGWSSMLLAFGLITILVHSAVHQSRRHARRDRDRFEEQSSPRDRHHKKVR